MRIAFVDSLAVGGGLSRFSYMLCKSLLEFYPDFQIDYWVNGENLKRTPELLALKGNIRVREMDMHKPLPLWMRAANKAGMLTGKKIFPERNDILEIEQKIRDYDIAYFPSAHMMRRPNLNIPMVGTLHDFNWKYFFGTQTFSNAFISMMNTAIMEWMNGSVTVCSAEDVVNEARKLYPGAARYPEVIHIAPVVLHQEMSDERADKILEKLDIQYPYLLFPGNFLPHKNHLNLVSGFALLKEQFGYSDLKLLLSGVGSDKVKFGIAEKRGIRVVVQPSSHRDFDIRGMGYLPNESVDALIKRAKLMVSPSIYEAICTPGMDAWSFGTPTAISDIPPFREHEQVWGIRSAFFNPMDPANIAHVIHGYLQDYDRAKNDGETSRHNMGLYTWQMVAGKYVQAFQKAINEKAT